MSSSSSSSTALPGYDPNRSRWIPWAFVGGMLLVVAVNAVLIVSAFTTFAGVTTIGAYDRGRAYNTVLREAARQESLGWSARVAMEPGGLLVVSATDRAGQPLAGRLEGLLLRPLDGETLPLGFAQEAPGRWIAQAGATLRAGQWEARLTLRGPAGADGAAAAVLDIRQRVLAP